MLVHIIVYILMILSIDLFHILYKKYKNFYLKRQIKIEKSYGMADDELSTIEDVTSKFPIIVYSLAVILGGFLFNFVDKQFFESNNFFHVLTVNIELTLIILFFFLSIGSVVNIIKNALMFIKGFRNAMIKQKNRSETISNNVEDENDLVDEEIDEDIEE